MKSLLNKYLKRAKELLYFRYTRKSFSQFGEDLILEQALDIIKDKNISYLDIGANHPYFLSNTYYFYSKGSYGTLIEPDPKLFRILKKKRPLDNVLNIGVGFGNKIVNAKLYIMSNPALNTFSFEEAKRIETETKDKIIYDINMELIPINFILEDLRSLPSFISIDVEGLDYQILESINFQKYRPALICAETLTYQPLTGGVKIKEIINLMKKKKYKLFADTRLNTIFIDENRL
tara:strand:- start:214 stop:915 length:702 start_codon:yes stop_codon:yes gene_type:complete